MSDSKHTHDVDPTTPAEVIDRIHKNLRLLVRPGQVTELRALNCGGTVSGYFDHDHLAGMAAAAAELEHHASGVYLVANPVSPDRLAARPNATARAGTGDTTQAAHVVGREALLVDFDPVRPGGVSATEAEKGRAAKLAGRVWRHLGGLGWPAPLVADSGNGMHLIYRVNLPVEDGGLVRRVLQALAARFDTDGCKIDRAVHDPARLVKIPGTLARKGEPTPDRPHRRSRLLHPGDGVVVPVQLLEAMAAGLAPSARPAAPAVAPVVLSDDPAGRVPRARAYLAALPAAVSGEGGHDATFRAACAAVVDFGLSQDEARPLLAEYNARCVPPWSEKELEHKLSDAAKKAAEEPGRVGRLLAAGGEPAAGEEGDEDGPKDILLRLAEGCCEFWHTPDDQKPFVSVRVGEHRQHMPVKGQRFRHWLSGAYYRETRENPKATVLADALNLFAARALFDGPARQVFTRVANLGDRIYLDLCDPTWRAVEVTADGWRLVDQPPVCFRRPAGMRPLPEPARGGDINGLRAFVNAGSDADFRLMVAYLLGVLRGVGPYPILAVYGEQGSAKTATCRTLRELVDPNKANHRAEPREARDVMIAASNSHVLVFDNLSRLEPWQSDLLCMVLTGGGFSTRMLYSDDDEMIFEVCKPIAVNGISEVVIRPDLLDRAVALYLPVIPPSCRRRDEDVKREFESARPGILGALLDGVATALREQDAVELPELPRMADFAHWVTAAETAFGWPGGTLLADYTANIGAATNLVLDDTPIFRPLNRLLDANGGRWPKEGEVKNTEELLHALTSAAGGISSVSGNKGWPNNARALSGTLRRLAPALRAAGIEVEFPEREKTGDRKRPVVIRREPPAK